MARYVALGSSMAAGPGIRPRAEGSPRAAMRSARNYPHLVADRLGLDLHDVTYSGATTAHVLRDRQNGTAPQIEALDGTEELITISIGGNDVLYVPGIYAALLTRPIAWTPVLGTRIRHRLSRAERDRALDDVASALLEVATAVRRRSPGAQVLFVEYLTLLPPAGQRAFPLTAKEADLFRHVAARLSDATAAAAEAAGCGFVPAGRASLEHHPHSAEPWSVSATLPLPGRPLAYHPNAEGMRRVADLVVQAAVGGDR